MADDIATKIEFLLEEGAKIIKEQADEIERLKTEISELRAEVQRLSQIARY